MSGTGTSTTIHWDADNNRIKIERGDRTWQFLYDPTASVPSVLLSLDSTNGTEYCIREPGGELLADCESEFVRSYYYDALGNAVYVSSWGNPYNGVAYGAWGDVVESMNTPDTPVQFVGDLGYYTHDSTAFGSALGSLMQLGVRFYDAGIGRFTQRDPIGFRGGLNSYEYVGGLPTSELDPWGLKCLSDFDKCLIKADMKYANALGKAYQTWADCIGGAAWYPPPISLILLERCRYHFTKDFGKAVFQHNRDIYDCHIKYQY